MKKIALLCLSGLLITSCVSKKKYVAMETQYGESQNELMKTRAEKEDLEKKFAQIEARVDEYNSKINSLTDENVNLMKENDVKLETVGDAAVISNEAKAAMMETLKNVDPSFLAEAKTLKDSMNLAISYNLQKSFDNSNMDENEDITVDIDETVVMISISDKMLFRSGSYYVSNKADHILQKLADIVNSELSLDVMVEGHTDSQSINTDRVRDNWDLSVLRATSVVRKLQNDFNVAPEQLIASGRSSFQPVADNNTRENRAKNRRTRIVLMPNINKFFAMMSSGSDQVTATDDN
jgi:chemotaxis protein MotB